MEMAAEEGRVDHGDGHVGDSSTEVLMGVQGTGLCKAG